MGGVVMTVGELISELEKADKSAIVYIDDNFGGLNNAFAVEIDNDNTVIII